jgi:hypothetical protein
MNATITPESTNNVKLSDIPHDTLVYWFVYFNQLKRTVNFYFLIAITPIGVLSNLLALVIYSRPNLNSTTIGVYNQSISIANVLALIFGFLMYSGLFISFDFNTHSHMSCQAVMFLRKSVHELSPMIETLFTLDRFLIIVYPTRFVFLRKKSISITLILMLVPLLLVMNCMNLFFYSDVVKMEYTSSVTNETKTIVHKLCNAPVGVLISSDVIVDMFRCVFPLVITVVLNILIVRKLHKSSRTTQMSNTNSLRESRDRQFTRSLVFLNLYFAVFNLPRTILVISKDAYYYLHRVDYYYVIINFAWSVAFDFGSLHFVLFFYISYYFNRLFRNEVNAIFVRVDSMIKKMVESVRACVIRQVRI